MQLIWRHQPISSVRMLPSILHHLPAAERFLSLGRLVLAGETRWAPWACDPSSTFSNLHPHPPFLTDLLMPNTWFRAFDSLCSSLGAQAPSDSAFHPHPVVDQPILPQDSPTPQTLPWATWAASRVFAFSFVLFCFAPHSLFIFTESFTLNNPTRFYPLLCLISNIPFYNLLP